MKNFRVLAALILLASVAPIKPNKLIEMIEKDTKLWEFEDAVEENPKLVAQSVTVGPATLTPLLVSILHSKEDFSHALLDSDVAKKKNIVTPKALEVGIDLSSELFKKMFDAYAYFLIAGRDATKKEKAQNLAYSLLQKSAKTDIEPSLQEKYMQNVLFLVKEKKALGGAKRITGPTPLDNALSKRKLPLAQLFLKHGGTQTKNKPDAIPPTILHKIRVGSISKPEQYQQALAQHAADKKKRSRPGRKKEIGEREFLEQLRQIREERQRHYETRLEQGIQEEDPAADQGQRKDRPRFGTIAQLKDQRTREELESESEFLARAEKLLRKPDPEGEKLRQAEEVIKRHKEGVTQGEEQLRQANELLTQHQEKMERRERLRVETARIMEAQAKQEEEETRRREEETKKWSTGKTVFVFGSVGLAVTAAILAARHWWQRREARQQREKAEKTSAIAAAPAQTKESKAATA